MDKPFYPLQTVDRVEVLTLMDNYVDLLLPDAEGVKRPARAGGGEIPTDTFLAEHGLSLLISVYRNGESHTILFDTGYSPVGVPRNMEKLGVETAEIEAIVISHAHMDHTGSLYTLLERISRPVPVVVHPEALVTPRYLEGEDGLKRRFPATLERHEIEKRQGALRTEKTPTLLAKDTILVSGEVPRVTPFEKGLPNALIERNGHLEKDAVLDDQALAIRLRGEGLVVISGCSHSGIINTVAHARKITGEEKVHAILGGFHLSGTFFEQILEETLEEMRKIDPQVIVPMHCTGWKAVHRFEKAFPSAFVLNSVGSRLTFPPASKAGP
jgi:7,8-dihydropterin-6-yl-methyl-4-(beta-D-ribofuranosyl)aminobenzene 5'-phosphate synthase